MGKEQIYREKPKQDRKKQEEEEQELQDQYKEDDKKAQEAIESAKNVIADTEKLEDEIDEVLENEEADKKAA